MDSRSCIASTRTATTATGGPRRRTPGNLLSGLLPLVLVGLLTACGNEGARVGADVDDEGGGGSCPAVLLLDGVRYSETPHRGQLPLAARIDGGARFTPCTGEDAVVPARRLRGLAPSTAFAAEKGGMYFLYVADTLADPCTVRYARCARS